MKTWGECIEKIQIFFSDDKVIKQNVQLYAEILDFRAFAMIEIEIWNNRNKNIKW